MTTLITTKYLYNHQNLSNHANLDFCSPQKSLCNPSLHTVRLVKATRVQPCQPTYVFIPITTDTRIAQHTYYKTSLIDQGHQGKWHRNLHRNRCGVSQEKYWTDAT